MAVETESRPRIAPGTIAIFIALLIGAVALTAYLILHGYIRPIFMTPVAVILAYTVTWVPPAIQKIRDRLARKDIRGLMNGEVSGHHADP